jgi:CHASE2 domain-containing sensor protein
MIKDVIMREISPARAGGRRWSLRVRLVCWNATVSWFLPGVGGASITEMRALLNLCWLGKAVREWPVKLSQNGSASAMMASANTPTGPQPMSPCARSVGACTTCLMVALLVCVLTYLLRAVDFPPLRALVSLEDRLYTLLIPPPLELENGFHAIIFVEIDDEAIRRWGARSGAAGGTPRTLLAEITHMLRRARASVIFLDYDFRNQLQGDSALRAELATYSATPVLLPKYFSSGLLPPCDEQTEEKAPIELETVFDDLPSGNAVAPVHSIVVLGAYGLIDGTCSAYKVRVGGANEIVLRTAAMLRALQLAGLSRVDSALPHLIPIRWWIQNDTELLRDRAGKLAYARINTSLYIHKDRIDLEGITPSSFQNAIVIVGSTHRWSGDVFATPVGELPGALVHANLGLELESYSSKEVPLPAQFIVEAVLILLSVIITFFVCWYPIYKRLPGQLSLLARVFRLFREGLVIIVFGIMVAGSFLLLARSLGDCLAGWRFGMLSFIIGALVVLLIEVIAAIADAAAKLAEALADRLSQRRSAVTEPNQQATEAQGPE